MKKKIETSKTLYFSPSFIYNQINNGVDGGSTFIDALNLLSQQGCALWDDMPYNEYDYFTKPTYSCKANAKKYRIDFWRRVNVRDIKEVKAQINAGYPVLIGAAIDQGFVEGGYNSTWGDYIWKYSRGYSKGGHAMLVVGYDNQKNAFKIINSWGEKWGNNGYCYIDYNHFISVVREGYVTKDAINGPSDITIKPDNKPIYIPDNKPTDFAKISFNNSMVEHNVYDSYYGKGMRITGQFDIPSGIGKIFQVSVHFYFSNTNIQVGSLMPPKYSDMNGFAATGTQVYYIPYNGIKNSNWVVFIPYNAFNINQGYHNGYQYVPYTTYMYAIPTLFIDNFGVAKGNIINFYVYR